ncbi:hypothetical protein [Nonomuraea cavernae]|uniref:Integral membrane protein n=1 Tax=Nonomuraea cavernae TaxID=2045107 RepID=A0A918DFB4_9ACTN|nr:hypothetical protein [Nonomuraea cavernae]MCA2184488.1 hypothetical protein [Nonomuraea cavernae]GGO63638.1 hypothetical protein GCM10012289_11170 [Nonomuraea cavernae]
MPDHRPIREDLQATLDARRDLGPDYEAALVDSFAERLDATIAARVSAELHRHGPAPRPSKGPGASMIPLALGSMGLGVPLTAIASANAGLLGLAVTWMAIAIINIAAAMAIMRRG